MDADAICTATATATSVESARDVTEAELDHRCFVALWQCEHSGVEDVGILAGPQRIPLGHDDPEPIVVYALAHRLPWKKQGRIWHGFRRTASSQALLEQSAI